MNNLKLEGTGTWHGHFKFNDFISINEIPTGCGINYIRNITSLNEKDFDNLLEALKIIANQKLLQEFVKGKTTSKILPCGTFICTLGGTYQKQYEPYILKIGFVEVANYPNKAHVAFDHTQKLYILHL